RHNRQYGANSDTKNDEQSLPNPQRQVALEVDCRGYSDQKNVAQKECPLGQFRFQLITHRQEVMDKPQSNASLGATTIPEPSFRNVTETFPALLSWNLLTKTVSCDFRTLHQECTRDLNLKL